MKKISSSGGYRRLVPSSLSIAPQAALGHFRSSVLTDQDTSQPRRGELLDWTYVRPRSHVKSTMNPSHRQI